MTFGEKIKLCRNAFNITQEQLADKLNTTKQVVSRYESGQRIPKLTTAQQYANALNIPLFLLIDPKIPFSIWEHYSLIEDYERGDDSIRSKIVDRYGVDPRIATDYGALREENPNFPRESLACEAKADPEEARLVQLYRELNGEGQAKLTGYADDLVASGRYKKDYLPGLGQKQA